MAVSPAGSQRTAGLTAIRAEDVYPEERSEDFHPAECNEDAVHPAECNEDAVAD